MALRGAALLLTTAMLLNAGPAAASMDAARAAQAHGDLRTAQIELLNAVRDHPGDASIRAALASVSLDLGDGDAAEKAARAALDHGFDVVAGTELLLRAYLVKGRPRDLLRDFPVPRDPAKSAIAAQVAAARAMAQLTLDERSDAESSVAEALKLGPNEAAPHLAAASLDRARGDRAAAEAQVDQALKLQPNNPAALVDKAGLALERGAPGEVGDILGPLLARAPGNVAARILRAQASLTLGKDAEAQRDVDAAIKTKPNSAVAVYLRAKLLMRAQNWKGADEALQRLGPTLANYPDGYLLAAVVKRALGQTPQALDFAQRYAARQPADPRGAKLLAAMDLDAHQPDAAAQALSRLADHGGADAQAFLLLARAHAAAGRPGQAVAALQKAVALAPKDPDILTQLAAARLAAGDMPGAAEAAQSSLRVAPDQPGVHEMLAITALTRGDIAAAAGQLDQLDAASRDGELARVLAGGIQLGRLDFNGARATFETVLKQHPDSINARLDLARVLFLLDSPADSVRVLAEVVQRQPGNVAAITQLTALAGRGSPAAAAARQVLETAQAASPAVPQLALGLAGVQLAGGDPEAAAKTLETPALTAAGQGVALPLARARVYVAAGRWKDAELAARAALAEDPQNTAARREVALVLAHQGPMSTAETVLREGLRLQPANPVLQGTLVGLIQQERGLDAALAAADELAKNPHARPASLFLRGDLLVSAKRAADAAGAFAAAGADAPSAPLALHEALAWQQAGEPAKAAATLDRWLQHDPDDAPVLEVRAQLDIDGARLDEAEQRLEKVIAQVPSNVTALNNLAWVVSQHDGPTAAARARGYAERAYFLSPRAETGDTLGWILARSGDAKQAIPLLRVAVAATSAAAPQNRTMSYHLAFALREAGDRDHARHLLDHALAGGVAFPERADAERLLAELNATN